MPNDDAAWEDTKPGIVLSQLRHEHRELRGDVKQHDGKIESLQGQVARVDERVKFLMRAFWLIAGGVAALVGDAIFRHLR